MYCAFREKSDGYFFFSYILFSFCLGMTKCNGIDYTCKAGHKTRTKLYEYV